MTTDEQHPQTPPMTDPQVLRAMTHPVRLRLYELLVAEGPATAARLSRYVPVAPGSLSYHLRTLAACGFVVEAEGPGTDGRERWWRAVPGGMRFSSGDFAGSAGGREALAAAQRVLAERRAARLREWEAGGPARWGENWADAAVSYDGLLRLTPDELREFGTELDALLERWGDRTRARAAAGTTPEPDTEQVFVIAQAFPFEGGTEG
ncbi:helix-turn-helix domain-containing protein [Streptomyces sp. NPDC093225]|uniref:helix-turn-helix domain-containing protein n=1 Tax=Streptomyces sp. NPDC093225 TaxID=3366034 RepID=UPI00382AEE0C